MESKATRNRRIGAAVLAALGIVVCVVQLPQEKLEEPSAPEVREEDETQPPSVVDGARQRTETRPTPAFRIEELRAAIGPPSGAPERPIAGAIRGVLLSERGAWTREELPRPDHVVLDLVSTDEARVSRRGRLLPEEHPDGGFQLAFAFEDVPEGVYELVASSLDNFRWHPESLVVRPPAEGIEIFRYDADPTLPLAFDVHDASTGEAIEGFRTAHVVQTVSPENGVLMHAGPLDPEAFPLDRPFRWSLWADGYAPAFGTESDFVEADGRRVATVLLERGWGRRFVVVGRAPTMRPLPGARNSIDGVSVGTTDFEGALVVRWPQEPEEIRVDYHGWTLACDPFDPSPGTPVDVRGYVSALVLRAPE